MDPPTVLVVDSSTTQVVRRQNLIVVGLVTSKSREFPSVCEPLSGSLSLCATLRSYHLFSVKLHLQPHQQVTLRELVEMFDVHSKGPLLSQ